MELNTNTLRCAILLVLAIVAVSCGGDTNPIGPANQPEVANLQDNFQFQASNLTGTTQTLTYTWANSGTSANVNQSGVVSGGPTSGVVSGGPASGVVSGVVSGGPASGGWLL